DEPVPEEDGVEADGRAVVEVDPAVELQPGLVQPAEAGGVEEHEQPVEPRVEPGRGPVPEEEAADEEVRHRQQEDEERPAEAGAQVEGEAGEEEQGGEGEEEPWP